jgi:hypothetical protein
LTILKLVQEWQPGTLGTELKYRDSLAALLREKLGEAAKIEKEYRHSGTTIDIYVKQQGFFSSSEVFIELKRNLLHKSDLDRLVGQIESLQPGRNTIIIVLCGETNPALVGRLKEKYKAQSYEIYGYDAKLAIVMKEVPAKVK